MRKIAIGAFVTGLVMCVIFPVSLYASQKDQNKNLSAHGGGYAVTGQLDSVGYTAQIYDASNGLPTSDANYILGASDGYVWIGSYSGIIRYDGSVFERLDTSGGLTSGRGLFEDSLGRIWVATNDNGVVVIDKENTTHFTYRDGLASSSIRGFAEDNYGNVYIGSTAGVSYVDSQMQFHVLDDERINNERILKLDTDLNGRIYGHTTTGAVFSIDSGKISHFYTSEELGIETITTILADPENAGRIYYGTESTNVYYGIFGENSTLLKRISVEPCEMVQWMSYDCGRVWICSQGMLGYLDENEVYTVVSDLPMSSSIEMMTSDYQGNMWVASSAQGVMKIVTNNFHDLTSGARLPKDVVNATCMKDGTLYIGTGRGLQIYNQDYGRIYNELTNFIGDARIRCIAADSRDNLWISTFTHDLGLVCRDSDGTITNYTTNEGLPSNEVRCTTEASDGSILIGTNRGLAIIKDKKVVRTMSESSLIRNLVFLSVCEGEDGKIYVGTDGDGIYVIDGSDVKTIGRDDGLTSDVILRIKKDEEKGVYWIVTSNSIEYMKDGMITNVTTFPYNNNYDLYYDNSDGMWVLSSYGIYCVNRDDMINDSVKDYRLYTSANGVTNTPTSNSYSEKDDEGNLYISGRTGVSVVNIDHFYETSEHVKTGIHSVTMNNEIINPGPEGEYTIPADMGRVQITPSVFDYTLTNPLIHIYLEGSDDDGITVERSKLTSLEYTGLKYGYYILHVQILSSATGEVVQDDTFMIVKKPMVTELLIVRIGLLLLLVLLAGFIVWRVMKGTVIRQQYEQIRAAKDEAERANSAKSRFLANMSHEIRTPINTIMGMDEMILREDATGVPQGYFMSVINYALDIRNASESLLGLINDLLDMSKIESGKMNLVEQEYDTQDLLRSIISMIRVRSAEKDLTFEVRVDEILPMRLYGDAGKIKQILLNLLTNAVKYTNMGGFTLDVSVDSRIDDKVDLSFKVRDTGIGVKEEDLDKLFTAYQRLDEDKNSGIQGTGLGLDISRRFAELMNGRLTCTSVYGEGSEFILAISQHVIDSRPVGIFSEQDDSAARGPYVPQFVAPDADVLVVDDNPMNLNVIKGLLKATKMFVTTVESGEECLDKLKYGTFNVVLLDHMMPGMDGVETLARIREDHPELPVYALTANASAGEKFYIDRGFTGYLQKPIDSMALEKAILKHLPEEIVMRIAADDVEADLTELPEDLKWIEEVEGISLEEGIKNAGGVRGFIHAINMFNDTVDDNAHIIEEAYKNNDIKLYTIKVHALKSSARIVGATELSDLAQKLEDAGNREDMAFINENAERLLNDYRAFRAKLNRLGDAIQEDDAGKEAISDADLADAYEALKELIPQMDYDGVEMIIGQLREYKLPGEDAAKVSQLEKLLKLFDWDKMEEMMQD